ncbi:glycosyltransferase [Bacillus sp. 166amftsu]|uniref:glycosyltransferase n=1 Tax=Bacillus sp. 166amftsu TaxID=1761753 RepID=UPI0008981A41|nr:glycosyltransferase [Bacillus sp. 166amftsu]SDZ25033.1 Glycosyltransferase involved in cell wall bisynthesis [Bacillus sp. 166amftsu]
MDDSQFFIFTGNEKFCAQNLFHSVKNSFTYEFLVKPRAVHKIDRESQKGCSGTFGQRYLISAEYGGDEETAGVGVSVGTNGISVYEHSVNYLPATLVFQGFISDWTHVTVVYEDRTPTLYINGELIKRGLPSTKANVLASGVFGGLDPYGFFIGQLKYIRIWDYPKSAKQIKEILTQKLKNKEKGLVGYWEFQRDSSEGLVFSNHKLNDIPRRGILFVMNPIGGGTEHYQNLYIEKNKHKYEIYKLWLNYNTFHIKNINNEFNQSYNFKSYNFTIEKFRNILSILDIELIYINHLILFPIPLLMNLIQDSGVDYIYFIHDFYCVCPLVNLINSDGIYCNNETNEFICQNCLNKSKAINIKNWRENFLSFLQGAKKVIAPSNSTKEMIQKHFPLVHIDVKEHSLSSTVRYTFNPQFVNEEKLNIAFVGYNYYIKGSHILYELKDAIEREKLPIYIKVIGSTDRHQSFRSTDGKFIVTGPYDNTQISDLLASHKVSLTIMSSICPETFSYTTTEAMFSGYPVITFDMGAPAERVRRYNGGWILESVNSTSILQLLKQLLNNRNEILEKANNLLNISQNKL